MSQESQIDLDDLLKEHEEKHSMEKEIDKIFAEPVETTDKPEAVVSDDDGFIIYDPPADMVSPEDDVFIRKTEPAVIVPPVKKMSMTFGKAATGPVHINPPGLWRCLCGFEENDTKYCLVCGRYWEECQQEP